MSQRESSGKLDGFFRAKSHSCFEKWEALDGENSLLRLRILDFKP
jgi:hypothetical protein